MKHILPTLAFYAKHPGWHTFAKNPSQHSAIRSLERRGFLEVKWDCCQAKFTGKVFA